MGRAGFSGEYQDLTDAACHAEQLPKIEVTRQVMERVRDLESGRRRRGSRLMSKTVAATGMLTLMLLVAVSAYAASEYIQLRNSKGVVKVQHMRDDTGWLPDASQSQANSLSNQYEWKVQSLAKPGELTAYYIRGTQPSVPESALHFTFKEQRLTDYAAFLQETQRTGAPVLPEKTGQYTFKYGGVYASAISSAELADDPLYKQTLDELVGEARDNTARNLFMKAVPWNKAGSVNATYTKEGAIVGISAVLLQGSDVTVMQKAESKADKLTVEGREIVYNHVVRPEVSYHYLNWYNEQQDAYYMLTTYGDRELSKGQLLQMAGDLIRGGL